MKRRMLSIAVCFYLVILGSVALASQSAISFGGVKPVPTKQNHTAQPTGEEVFNNNCSRCHMPPMAISPRITGTIVMHMRTRARLSREDEQLLLKYLAP